MLYCIVTADEREIEEGDLDRFLESCVGQAIRVVLVLRDVSDECAARYRQVGTVVSVLRSPKAGISQVRNMGLLHLTGLGLSPDDVISFPDDDCIYPDGFVGRLFDVFDSTGADLIVGSYGEQLIARSENMPLSFRSAIYDASSVTVFLKWKLLIKVGGFNPGLGVGSPNFQYGEDNDFAVRAKRLSSINLINPSLRVWHLEERATTGRNPKGYLTCCLINIFVPAVFREFVLGLAKGVMQDVIRVDTRFTSVRDILAALNYAKVGEVRRGSVYARSLLLK